MIYNDRVNFCWSCLSAPYPAVVVYQDLPVLQGGGSLSVNDLCYWVESNTKGLARKVSFLSALQLIVSSSLFLRLYIICYSMQQEQFSNKLCQSKYFLHFISRGKLKAHKFHFRDGISAMLRLTEMKWSLLCTFSPFKWELLPFLSTDWSHLFFSGYVWFPPPCNWQSKWRAGSNFMHLCQGCMPWHASYDLVNE